MNNKCPALALAAPEATISHRQTASQAKLLRTAFYSLPRILADQERKRLGKSDQSGPSYEVELQIVLLHLRDMVLRYSEQGGIVIGEEVTHLGLDPTDINWVGQFSRILPSSRLQSGLELSVAYSQCSHEH